MKNIHVLNQQIYITTDEKIKEGDWIIDLVRNEISKANGLSNGDDYIVLDSDSFTTANQCKKIVLTTDFNLAPDVQKIDDKFLEWIVKNPTCRYIKVDKNWNYPLDKRCEYKIIIPQSEPKQETTYSYDEVRAIAYNAYCLGQLEEPTENKYNGWIQQFKK